MVVVEPFSFFDCKRRLFSSARESAGHESKKTHYYSNSKLTDNLCVILCQSGFWIHLNGTLSSYAQYSE